MKVMIIIALIAAAVNLGASVGLVYDNYRLRRQLRAARRKTTWK